MRLLITADLHYDVPRSREPAEKLADEVRSLARADDVLVLVGDTAGADLARMGDCLRLFADLRIKKLLVPGNHCLWCRNGETSIERYEKLIPQAAMAEGFEVLDHKPVFVGRVALVGSVGWYDYSFRYESLGIPLDFYRAKITPGAAEYLGGEYDWLIARHRDVLTEHHMSMGTRWGDGRWASLAMTDEEFVELLAGRLAEQLRQAAAKADRIIAFIHHLPFAELVPQNRPDPFAFAAAYMGAGRFGEVLLDCPKVTHVYCGHSHWPMRCRMGRLEAINVGSTYREKRLEILELQELK